MVPVVEAWNLTPRSTAFGSLSVMVAGVAVAAKRLLLVDCAPTGAVAGLFEVLLGPPSASVAVSITRRTLP